MSVDAGRARRILGLALPIIGGMVSQNVLNLVDTAMVGRLGDAALAAVGLGGFVAFMCMAIVLGISTGVQATAARRKGEGLFERMAKPLNAGLLLVLVAAPPLTMTLYWAAPHFFPLLNSDPDVIRHGVPYLLMRILGIVFIGMNFAFRGYWNATDRALFYMMTLIVMHAVNIFLNYVLIFGNFGAPAMGAAGAGLASTLSTAVGCSIYFALGWRFARDAGFLAGLPNRDEIRRLALLSLPTGLQQFFFAAGFVVTYWIIGQIGTRELAAANVLTNVMLVAILPGVGFGLASATLVGQALGRGDATGAARWGWDVVKLAVVVLAALGLPMLVFPDPILSVFITNPDTLALARLPMRIVGATMGIEAIGLVLMNSMLGAGAAHRVMFVSITLQWVFFLPLAFVVGPVLGLGLIGVWLLQAVYRLSVSAVFARLWHRGEWASAAV